MKRAEKGWAKIALGALAAIAVYAALAGLLALLIVRGTAEEGLVLPCLYVSACAAAFAGVCVADASGQSGAEGVCAAILWAAVVCIGRLAGAPVDGKKALLLALPILFGAVCAARLRRGKGRPAKKRRRSRK